MVKILFATLTAGIIAISASAASAQTSNFDKNSVGATGGASQGYNMTIDSFDSVK